MSHIPLAVFHTWMKSIFSFRLLLFISNGTKKALVGMDLKIALFYPHPYRAGEGGRGGGSAEGIQIPQKCYKWLCFPDFPLFLKKLAFWRRAWSLEISRGRLATPNARFRPCPTTQAADIAYQRHRLSATSQVHKHTAVRLRCCVSQLGGVKHTRFQYLSTFNPIEIVCK